MQKFSYVLTDAEGIHARPAGELVKQAKGYKSKVMISKDVPVWIQKLTFAV